MNQKRDVERAKDEARSDRDSLFTQGPEGPGQRWGWFEMWLRTKGKPESFARLREPIDFREDGGF